MYPIYLIAGLAILVTGISIGRWYQKRQDPLELEGRLLNKQLSLAKRIAQLQTGETAEQLAERARQGKVRADILALDQRNQTAG